MDRFSIVLLCFWLEQAIPYEDIVMAVTLTIEVCFLKITSLLAQYDPVLKDHFETSSKMLLIHLW